MALPTAVATIHTTLGDIKVNLFGNHAPVTVDNFIGLATGTKEWKHPGTGEVTTTPLYDGVIFHRIIKEFMLQGGDPLGQGTGGPGYEFDDEINPELNFNEPYVFAMANAGSRGGKGTNGSQFFIMHIDYPLPPSYSKFGRVLEGQEVVDAIANVDRNSSDKPLEPVVMERVYIEEPAS